MNNGYNLSKNFGKPLDKDDYKCKIEEVRDYIRKINEIYGDIPGWKLNPQTGIDSKGNIIVNIDYEYKCDDRKLVENSRRI